jgi:hypothetical protein
MRLILSADTQQVEPVSSPKKLTVRIPVCPDGDAHFAATVVFDLMHRCIDQDLIEALEDYTGVWLKENSFGAAVALVWSEGRKIYGPKTGDGWEGFTLVVNA